MSRLVSDRYRRTKERRQQEFRANPAAFKHGTVATYRNYGCRCDECRAASSRAWAAYVAAPVTPCPHYPRGGRP